MIIDLHHCEQNELRHREQDLREQFAGRDDVEIFASCSRNEFLHRIASRNDGGRSIALIDLRSETGDIEQSGLRIARTIVGNRALSMRTVPAVWTEHVSNSNVIEVRECGASGLISDFWVDEAGKHVLPAAIDRIRSAKAGDYFVFPPRETSPRLPVDPEDEIRAEAFERWFGFAPSELHFHLLWGTANAIELELLKEYVAEIGVASSPSAAKRQLERLQAAMRADIDALDRPESGNPEVARRFLAELMPPDFDPLPELNWPRLSTIQELLLSEPEVVSFAYLDDESLAMLELFLRERRTPQSTERKAKGSEVYKAIEDAVSIVATTFQTPEAVAFNIVHHAAHSIDDAYWDIRRHGNPREVVKR